MNGVIKILCLGLIFSLLSQPTYSEPKSVIEYATPTPLDPDVAANRVSLYTNLGVTTGALMATLTGAMVSYLVVNPGLMGKAPDLTLLALFPLQVFLEPSGVKTLAFSTMAGTVLARSRFEFLTRVEKRLGLANPTSGALFLRSFGRAFAVGACISAVSFLVSK